MKTSKHLLFSSLANGSDLRDLDGCLILTNVQSIELESGGRQCWNVTGYLKDKETTIFVRTVD